MHFIYGLIILLIFAVILWLLAGPLGLPLWALIFFFVAVVVLFLVMLSQRRSWYKVYNQYR